MEVLVTGRSFQVGDDTYVSLPIVNKSINRGTVRQCLCTEMLHWDDYREDRSISDGTPSMRQTFETGGSPLPVYTFTVGTDSYVAQLLTVSPALSGSSVQRFCAEMQHWDDYCTQHNVNTDTNTMASRFRSFDGTTFSTYDREHRKLRTFTGTSVALINYGEPKQTYCSEMAHWDDYVEAKSGAPPQPSMDSLFRTTS